LDVGNPKSALPDGLYVVAKDVRDGEQKVVDRRELKD
jgi:hypothetical protein